MWFDSHIFVQYLQCSHASFTPNTTDVLKNSFLFETSRRRPARRILAKFFYDFTTALKLLLSAFTFPQSDFTLHGTHTHQEKNWHPFQTPNRKWGHCGKWLLWEGCTFQNGLIKILCKFVLLKMTLQYSNWVGPIFSSGFRVAAKLAFLDWPQPP